VESDTETGFPSDKLRGMRKAVP